VFGELPKIFDRNFVIAFFLPVATFVAASLGLVHAYDLYPSLVPALKADILIGTTILGLATWVGGVILLAANRDVYRLFEGYGRLNPFRLFSFVERWQYRRLKRQISDLDRIYDSYLAEQKEPPEELNNRRGRLLRFEAERFPDREEYLLPTALGNTIRAFEVYSRVMYGLETIQGWSRLISVIPKSHLKLVDDAKAEADFWLNLGALSCLFVIEYAVVAAYTGRWDYIWIPAAAFALAVAAAWRAKSAAVEWGEIVKASFDVYLPSLLTKLQFPYPATKDDERKLWREFSQGIIYRWPELVPVRVERPEFTLSVKDQPAGVTEPEAEGPEEGEREGTKEEQDKPKETVEA
jgi:hypothetical protein